ncbi:MULTISPECIES: rod shape-determining protein RodA [Nocardiopsis]|uniref:peptidoglycan glycosyltransferase n=1 Tax=Nocardiopsis sinuspersici TaxID=501010 RepID=A0A1V3C309_9ACTN|nr:MULTISPECIES: rod shape-determining protein RodA [Nocardiopsis]NYH51252.1 rod shape determining protein RodA [Nocardiopsis sinuspersici]OOC55022.1 rod shape-determining protein RodA [Nocardiopsis sinuspersici]
MTTHLGAPRTRRAEFGRNAAGLARRLDWTLIVSVAALCAIGTLLVWSATVPGDGSDPLDSTEHLRRHLFHLVVGWTLCLAVASVDHRTIRAYAPIAYLVTVVLLALVLTPLGETINGSRGWIVIGGFQFQPSELAKVGLVLMLATLLGEPRDGEARPMTRDVLFCLVALAVPLALVMSQPDLGTTLVLGAIFLGMLTLSGAPVVWVAGMLVCGAVGAFCVWFFDVLKPYQVARIATLMNPTADPQGTGYNSNQALIAVGSGGFNGTGLFQGEQTHGQFVPEQHTDFIFTVAGEELGFVGAVLVIGLFGLILWRLLRTAQGCEKPYPRLLCVGAASWFGFQALINIGMCLGVVPVTGLPLPFVSYGGTAVVASMLALGLVLGVRSRDRGFV